MRQEYRCSGSIFPFFFLNLFFSFSVENLKFIQNHIFLVYVASSRWAICKHKIGRISLFSDLFVMELEMEHMKFTFKNSSGRYENKYYLLFFPQNLNLEDGKIIPQKLKRKIGKWSCSSILTVVIVVFMIVMVGIVVVIMLGDNSIRDIIVVIVLVVTIIPWRK